MPEVAGEGMSLVCLQYTTKFFGSYSFLRGPQNVMQGAHNIVMRDSTLYVAQNVCPLITALMV